MLGYELRLPDIDVELGECGPVAVVAIRGEANDTATMVRLAHQLLDMRVDGGHVVLDLDGLEVKDPASLCALFARLAAASDGVAIPTACSDPGLRRLLRACGSGTAGLAIFPSVEAACDVARPVLASA